MFTITTCDVVFSVHKWESLWKSRLEGHNFAKFMTVYVKFTFFFSFWRGRGQKVFSNNIHAACGGPPGCTLVLVWTLTKSPCPLSFVGAGQTGLGTKSWFLKLKNLSRTPVLPRTAWHKRPSPSRDYVLVTSDGGETGATELLLGSLIGASVFLGSRDSQTPGRWPV